MASEYGFKTSCQRLEKQIIIETYGYICWVADMGTQTYPSPPSLWGQTWPSPPWASGQRDLSAGAFWAPFQACNSLKYIFFQGKNGWYQTLHVLTPPLSISTPLPSPHFSSPYVLEQRSLRKMISDLMNCMFRYHTIWQNRRYFWKSYVGFKSFAI